VIRLISNNNNNTNNNNNNSNNKNYNNNNKINNNNYNNNNNNKVTTTTSTTKVKILGHVWFLHHRDDTAEWVKIYSSESSIAHQLQSAKKVKQTEADDTFGSKDDFG
jgi:hypothetical protein